MGIFYSKKKKSSSVRELSPPISGAHTFTLRESPPPIPPQASPDSNSENEIEADSNETVYVALYDYKKKRTSGDLVFKKGEYLEILDQSQSDWWKARKYKTNIEGYIPSNFIAKIKSIEAEPWYFGSISRVEARNLLLTRANHNGSFMVRKSETRRDEYTLSVRAVQNVRHYRIKQQTCSPGKYKYFITARTKFDSVIDLIDYYQQNFEGLVTILSAPCKKGKGDIPLTKSLYYNTRDDWEIPRSTLTFQRQLGQGQFGRVHQGLWNGKVPVAIKSLKPGSMNPKEFLAEAQLMKDLQHPRLIRLFAVCTTEEPIFIVTELMKNGSLLDYLRTKNRELTTDILLNMTIQITSGMAFLESKNYVHRDLAARNCLVGDKHVVKVADFGLARVIQENEYVGRVGACIPIKWTAPEAIKFQSFTTKSDVWAFGILLHEIFSYGQSPYPGMPNNLVLQSIENNHRMSIPENCPTPVYDIMLSTWQMDPVKRPTFVALESLLEDILLNEGKAYQEAQEIN